MGEQKTNGQSASPIFSESVNHPKPVFFSALKRAGLLALLVGLFALSGCEDTLDDLFGGSSVEVGETITGSADSDNSATYNVDLEGGATYQFTFTRTGELNFVLRENVGGEAIESSGVRVLSFGVRATDTFTYTPSESEKFIIEIFVPFLYDTGGNYSFRIVEVPDDHPNSRTGAPVVAIGGSIGGDLEVDGDKDWFRVELIEGRFYQFDLEGSRTSMGTLFNPFLELHNASRKINEDNDDGLGLNSIIFYTVPVGGTGTYYLVASDSGNNDTGTYTLTARENSLTVGMEQTGRLSGGQSHFYSVNLSSGSTYQFGLVVPFGADFDLRLRNNVRTLLDFSTRDGAGRDEDILYTPTQSGIFVLEVDPFGSSSGNYTLRFQEFPQVTSLSLGSVRRDSLSIQDGDKYYNVNLIGGTTYQFFLDVPLLADFELELFPPGGSIPVRAGTAGQGADEQFFYTPPESGSFIVRVSQFSAIGGTYDLLVD